MTATQNRKRRQVSEFFYTGHIKPFSGVLQCNCLSKRCTPWWLIMFTLRQPICAKRRNRSQNDAVSPFKRRTEPNRFENVQNESPLVVSISAVNTKGEMSSKAMRLQINPLDLC